MLVRILCGISGSGKSTMVERLMDKYVNKGQLRAGYVCSADHFFINADGDYHFDPSELSMAHAECLKNFVTLVLVSMGKRSNDLIIVDNTNTTVAEVAPYAALALAYGADLELIIIDCDPDLASKRQVHGVPTSVVQQQHNRLTKLAGSLPTWWSRKVVKAG